jgi:hypothetical protein
MVGLQVRFFTYAAENRFLFCRGPGSLPVLVGASFAVQKGDPFAHQEHTIWPNLWEIHSISFPIGLAFWRGVPLCGLLFSLLGLLQVLMLVLLFSRCLLVYTEFRISCPYVYNLCEIMLVSILPLSACFVSIHSLSSLCSASCFLCVRSNVMSFNSVFGEGPFAGKVSDPGAPQVCFRRFHTLLQ